jgi:hypothetical protein
MNCMREMREEESSVFCINQKSIEIQESAEYILDYKAC